MMKIFDIDNDTITTQITVTNGFFDGGVGTLAGSNLSTSSLSATQKSYYYNLQYNSKDHFSVTYGHIGGSGSAEQNANVEGTTQAIYKQFYNFTEPNAENVRDGAGWSIVDGTDGTNAVTQNDVYIIAAERLQMKDRLNPGTWTINLSGSLTDGTGTTLVLTDDSKTNTDSTNAPFGSRFNIVSGSAGTIKTAAADKNYGFFYPDAGVLVLSANALSSSLPGKPDLVQSGSGHLGFTGTGLTPDLRVAEAVDNADKISEDHKKKLEAGKEDLKKAIESNDVEKIKSEKDTVQKVVYEVSAELYKADPEAAQQAAQDAGQPGAEQEKKEENNKDDENVVDAEFSEVKK